MEERLQVRIEADIKDFQKGMSQVERNLQRADQIFKQSSRSAFQLENAISKLTREHRDGSVGTNEYRGRLAHLNAELVKQRSNVDASAKELSRLNSEMRRMESSSLVAVNNQTARSFEGLSQNIRGSRTAGLAFNQMLMAASMGSITARGSLYQLSTMFDFLGRSATSAGSSVRAGFAAMVTGPNLLLLSITAATAAFSLYKSGALGFLKTNADKKKSFEDLRKELDEYRKSLDDVSQQSIIGRQNAQQELSTLDALIAQATNMAVETENRAKAVNELQKQYPEYFSNLNSEQGLTSEVSESLERLRNNLIETARAYAYIDKIKENSIAIVDLESRALTRAAEIQEKLSSLADARLRDEQRRAAMGGRGGGAMALLSEESRVLGEINKLLEEQTETGQQIGDLNKSNNDLVKQRNALLEKGVDLTSKTGQELTKAGNVTQAMVKNLIRFSDQLDYHSEKYGHIISLIRRGGQLTADQAVEYDNLLSSLREHEKQLERISNIDLDFNFRVDDKSIDDSYKRISEELKRTIIQVPITYVPTETVDAETQAFDEAQNKAWKQMIADRERTLVRFASQMESTLGRAFESSIMRGDSFFDAIEKGFKQMLARLAAQLASSLVLKFLGMMVGGPLGGILASGAGGMGSNLLGSLFGPTQTPSVGIPSLGGGGNQSMNINVTGVLKGSDMHLQNKRAGRDADRFYGIN